MKCNNPRRPRTRHDVLKFPGSRPRRKAGRAKFAVLFTGMVALGGAIGWQLIDKEPKPVAAFEDVGCASPTVVDGDTLRCGARRIRLASIDAPEKPGHCNPGRRCVAGDPFASTRNLEQLVGQGPMICRQTDTDRYGRTVALCSVAGKDLSCGQVHGGYAEIRYGSLDCRGNRRGG